MMDSLVEGGGLRDMRDAGIGSTRAHRGNNYGNERIREFQILVCLFIEGV